MHVIIFHHSDTETIIDWIPLITTLLASFFGSLGLRTLTFTVIVEIMPEQVKDVGVTFFAAFCWLGFMNIRFNTTIMVFISAVIHLIGAASIYLLLPETRRKSSQEIIKLF